MFTYLAVSTDPGTTPGTGQTPGGGSTGGPRLLPVTGAELSMGVLIAGIALILGGAGIWFLRRRRS